MTDSVKINAIVGQSGGPTAAINATLAGVIRGVAESCGIDTLYGAFNGIEGILNGDYCNLSDIYGDDGNKTELLSMTPAAALGSCRVKLPDSGLSENSEKYDRIFAFFKSHGIRYFFYIGGNDSMDTVSKLQKASASYNAADMRFIGIPKTIDNDLCGTDHTPGYGSAAKYIASTISEIVRDCSVYTVKSVTIVEIMGRDSGWLTAAAALPRFIGGIGPDLVYLPERVFNTETFLSDIEELFKIRNSIVVAVSEGIKKADGHYVGEGNQNGAADVFGHRYLSGTAKALEYEVKNRFGCKVRSFDINLPQRCAGHLMSETDRTEAIAVGRAAVCAALDGADGCLICYERNADSGYGVTFVPKDIHKIANKIKTVPDSYINATGNGITAECAEYIKPLIQGEVGTVYQNGIPVYETIDKETQKVR